MNILRTHHVAIITADYRRSKDFYTRILSLEIVAGVFRAERDSHKLDLKLPDGTRVELFSFPNPPKRLSYPEACGLRHLAFEVADIGTAVAHLEAHGVESEPVRVDEYTGKRFTFFADPDGLPLELYERWPRPHGTTSPTPVQSAGPRFVLTRPATPTDYPGSPASSRPSPLEPFSHTTRPVTIHPSDVTEPTPGTRSCRGVSPPYLVRSSCPEPAGGLWPRRSERGDAPQR